MLSNCQNVEFIVYGEPKPQGSMRAFMPKGFKRPILTSDNKKLKPWRQEVTGAAVARFAQGGIVIAERPEAIEMFVKFFFPKPKSVKKSIRNKTTKPDVDKLARGILDSLTGVAYEDDSQVTALHVYKFFDPQPRAEIRIVFLDRVGVA